MTFAGSYDDRKVSLTDDGCLRCWSVVGVSPSLPEQWTQRVASLGGFRLMYRLPQCPFLQKKKKML